MPTPRETAKAKLVIIVGPFELHEHITKDLKPLGVKGYTSMRVDGFGAHGPRTYGTLDGANFRLEVVGTAEVAHKVLAHIAGAFGDREVIAYSSDVEAVPAEHFR